MTRKIGISFSKENFENYWHWFTPEDLQDEVELLRLSFEDDNTGDIEKCDGFMLTGGVDVHPSFYEGSVEYMNKPSTFQAERDHFEEKIYRYSQLKSLPLFGICRGMQLVNVLQGGKLIQDLDTGNPKHCKVTDMDKEHAVITKKETLLYEITGRVSGYVNSAHHQAIDPNELGNNLKINACDDGAKKIIEGIEFDDKTTKGFMLCVQWHPERMKDKAENAFSQSIKKRFLEEIKKVNKYADH